MLSHSPCHKQARHVRRQCTCQGIRAPAAGPIALCQLQAMLGLIVVVLLMAGIICVALAQTRSAYTASFGSLLDASNLLSPHAGASFQAG
jgi:hypothetical protein